MRETPSRRSFLARLGRGSAAAALIPGLDVLDITPGSAVPRLAHPAGDQDESYWRLVRAQFPIRAGIIPMNAANLCPAPSPVIEATLRAAADVDADVSFQNRARYGELLETLRGRLARYLGAAPDEIAIVRNTSEANNIIVGGVPLSAGDDVVVSDLNHPTNNVAWDVRARRFGYTVRRVSFAETPGSEEQILSAFRSALSSRTRVLSFTDVSNSTGVRMPTKALCALGRKRRIHVHVDGAQSFGALRRDLRDLGCDSYAASSHKWFMGPKEAGVLFVRAERAADIWPGVVGVGWGSGADTELVGARRFETLGQRNDATIAGMSAALDFHELIGAERIEARMLALAGVLCERLASIAGAALVTPPTPSLRAGVCIVRLKGSSPRDLHESLYTHHGIAGAPTGGLRLSPHIYNTMEDIEHAAEVVRVVAGSLPSRG